MSSSFSQVDTMQVRSHSFSPAGAFRALTRTSLAMLQLVLLCYSIGYSQTVRGALRNQDGAQMGAFLEELSRVTAGRASRSHGDSHSVVSQHNIVAASGSNTECTFTPKSQVSEKRRRASTSVAPSPRRPTGSSFDGVVGSVERRRGHRKRIQRPTSKPPAPPSSWTTFTDPPTTSPSTSLAVEPTSQPAVPQETSTGPPQESSSSEKGKESQVKRKRSGVERVFSFMSALSGGRHRKQQTSEGLFSTAEPRHTESEEVAGQGHNKKRSERRSGTLGVRFRGIFKVKRPVRSASIPAAPAAGSSSAGDTNALEGPVWSIPVYKESADPNYSHRSTDEKQLGQGGPTSGTSSGLVVTLDPREAKGKRRKWSKKQIYEPSRAAGARSSSVVDSEQKTGAPDPIYDLPPDARPANGSRDTSQVQETRLSEDTYDLDTWDSSFDIEDEEAAEPLSSHTDATAVGAVGERHGTSEHAQQEQEESIYEIPSTGPDDVDSGYASQAQQEPSAGAIYGNLAYGGAKITDSLSSPSKPKSHSSAQKSHAQCGGSSSPAKDETVDRQDPVYYQDRYSGPTAAGSGHVEGGEYEEISLGPSLLMQATEQEQRTQKKPATKKAKNKSPRSRTFLQRLLRRWGSTSPSLEQQSSASPVNRELAGPNFDSEEPIYEDMRPLSQEIVI